MKKRLVVMFTIMVLLSSSVLFAQTDSIPNPLSSSVLYTRTDSIPEPLSGHTLVFINDPDILLFGGDQSSRATINEFWIYNKDNSKWEKEELDDPPPRRKGHAATISNGKMYIFFGEYDVSELLDDVWKYDPSSNTWTECASGGASTPAARKNHSATLIGDNIYICGGLDSDGLGLSDFWSYHTPRQAFGRPSLNTRVPVPGMVRSIIMGQYMSSVDMSRNILVIAMICGVMIQ